MSTFTALSTRSGIRHVYDISRTVRASYDKGEFQEEGEVVQVTQDIVVHLGYTQTINISLIKCFKLQSLLSNDKYNL